MARDLETDLDPALHAERLGAAVRLANLGIFDHDHLHDELYFSPLACEIFGWPADQPIPVDVIWARIHRDDVAQVAQRVEHAHNPASNGLFSSEHRIVRPDGSVRWVNAQFKTIFDGEGADRRPLRTVGAILDVTERKEVERHARFLSDLDHALHALSEGDEITLTAARMLGEFLEVDRCAYAHVEPDEDHFVVTGDYTREPTHSIVGRHRMLDFGVEALRMMRKHQPFVLNDVEGDPRIQPQDLEAYRQTQIRASTCVPLHKGGRLSAGMAVNQARPRCWTAAEVELVTAVANRCWEALERARAERALRETNIKLQELNLELEQRVAQRTAQLRERGRKLRLLAARLSDAENQERRRIAYLLHDDLQQTLVAAKMSLEALRKKVDPAASQSVARIEGLVGDGIEASRTLAIDLFPPVLYDRGLAAALQWLGRHMFAQHELTVDVDASPAAEPANRDVQAFLYHAVRELLLNVVKHAGIKEARVTLEQRDGATRIIVEDKGRGCDLAERAGAAAETSGFGLFSIQQRVELLGGTCDVSAHPGSGCRVILTVPTAPPEDDAGESHL